jgi:hypothetical protein
MRAVKILICFCAAAILLLTGRASAEETPDNNDYRSFQSTLTRRYTLVTTHDASRQIRLTATGNVIRAEGYFSDAAVEEFYISGTAINGMTSDFVFNSDGADGGSFAASISGVPDEAFARLSIRFADGGVMHYRAEYDGEWFFGDNGLGARTMNVVENYFTASAEVSEMYISAARCPDELRETRAKLHEIVAEVTEGMDDDYEKAKALNAWVAWNIVYDRDAVKDADDDTLVTGSITRTLEYKRSVCIGITNTYIALLEAAGIKAVNIKGGIVSAAEGVPYELLTSDTVPHEWAAFWYEAENRWVYADPTWDRQGWFMDGEYDFKPPVFKFFDADCLALSLDHRGDRAELRIYMNSSEAAGEPHTSETIPPVMTVIIPAESEEPESSEDNYTVLYLVIGAMVFAAAVLLTVIIRIRR